MESPHKTHRILVVDDEPRVREVVARYLQRDGYEVEVAVDGEDARRSLADFRPDLVVLDIMLPGRLRTRGTQGYPSRTASCR